MKQVLFILFAIFVLSGGCKKYPEDDLWFHLRKPYKRLTSCSWKLESYRKLYPASYDPSCLTKNWACVFRTDGTCGGGCGTENGPGGLIASYTYNLNGMWKLIDDDKKIQITNGGHIAEWTILQLDRKRLKIISDSVEFTYNRSNETY